MSFSFLQNARLKAYSINEGLSVVEVRFLMPVRIMQLCAAFRDTLACDMLLWWVTC